MDLWQRIERSVRMLVWLVLPPEIYSPLSGFTLLYFAPFGLLIALMVWRRPREANAGKRLLWLFTLVLPWVFTGLWAGWFQRHIPNDPPNPFWVMEVPVGMVFLELTLVPVLITLMSGARIFTATAGFMNLCLTAWVWLWADQALSGIWL